ncbi:threonine aldolase family protein [Flavihumibacter profundi]|uniref:threonine aldolase family protein n=1 Tax=Flavihumibacter profundi TaxID=2716883 RepID=UPI001CC6A282|nr:aminotransferase class I/II-fold pyridoxal phosphate-dependent enzyme [Flavihumibacter profundi]MBZ5856134.1 aminotransferase class I/II-fold pyridoxal phosphate-dependent enzyme [Flavihumibacter profundi]
MPVFNRRKFLQSSGMSLIPALLPFSAAIAGNPSGIPPAPIQPLVKFFGDGEMFEPAVYLDQLVQMNNVSAIEKDRYGHGGTVAALEKKFEAITGKEKAMFMPTGTMANQLAIAVLSGTNTKVFVQETSHVFRDEADAAQSVHQKRLMPLAKGETYFTSAALQQAIESLEVDEVFKSGVGAVSIENPVRRADGRMVPIEEIRKISAYCRNNNIKLHLDGARIYLASAWSGISVQEYASYFDTIYISLYKYLGASGGAMLCGEKTVIDKMEHLVKIHGGTMYGNWLNAAMAYNRLEGIENRLKEAINRSVKIFSALNQVKGINISALDGGTNIYVLQLDKNINGGKTQEKLFNDFNIRIPKPDQNNMAKISVNETLLYQDTSYIIDAFIKSLTR